MKRVYSGTSIEEAEFCRMALRDHDIESVLEDEGGAMWAVGVPSTAAMFGISVDDRHEAAAIEVIRQVLDLRKHGSGKSPGTGEKGA